MKNMYAYEKLLNTITYIYERGTPAKTLGEIYGQELAQITADNDLPVELRQLYLDLCKKIEGLPTALHPDSELEDIRSYMLTLFGRLFQYPDYIPQQV
jgi:hypothetical protein